MQSPAETPRTLDPSIGSFVAAYGTHDWRRSVATLPESDVWMRIENEVLEDMRNRGAIVTGGELGSRLAVLAPSVSVDQLQPLVDRLLVKQVGAAVKSMVSRDGLHKCEDFGASVPDGLFWRKNASKEWPRQCLEDRYGWFSDSKSIRDLLSKLQAEGHGEKFCDAMGFTRQDGAPNYGYGPMYLMFYTQAQLESLDDIEFFRPLWPEATKRLRTLFKSRRDAGTLDQWLPKMWTNDVDAWEVALSQFQNIVNAVTDDKMRESFLEFSLVACKPMWDHYEGAEPASCDPRWHPVAAARHLLDHWFGANHLFMGDGFTWSAKRTIGHAEWLVSSFENLDVERVSIFPELE